MTIALTAALILTIIGHLWAMDRRDTRASEEHTQAENDWSAYTVSMHQTLEREREAHRADVQSLLQRIQAPEIAVIQHQQTTLPDENPYPLSDEESAEAQNERARMIAELERIENAGLV